MSYIRPLFPAPGAGAADNAVYSANVVGYTKINIGASINKMIGVQFTAVGGADVDIQDMVIDGLSAGDTLNIFGSGGYSTYVYDAETYIYYTELGDSDWVDQGPGWSNQDGWRAALSIAPGSGYWLSSSMSKAIASGGEVLSANKPLLNVGNGVLRMISNTMPVNVALQDIAFDGIAVGSTLNFFDGSKYLTCLYDAETYIYYSELGDSDWVDQGPGWSDEDGWRADINIAVGDAFWILSSSNITVTFPNPE